MLDHGTLKYKTSKKRCNLYLKGFDNETEQDLRNVFGNFGEIESVRLFPASDNKSAHAFICYKTPDQASAAKNANIKINGRPLHVNYYEIKQYRDIKNEDANDKKDFQRHQAENGQGTFAGHNMDQLTQILKEIFYYMQQKQGIQGNN